MSDFMKIRNGLFLGPQTSEPTGSDGMIYYNSTLNKFRKFENGAWSDFTAGSQDISAIAGENLNQGDLVYISVGDLAGDTLRTLGEAYRVDPTNRNRIAWVGFVLANTISGMTASIRPAGVITSTGLDVGAPYYATGLGAYTSTAPNDIGTYLLQVGVAISPTEILINSGRSATTTLIESGSTTIVDGGVNEDIDGFLVSPSLHKAFKSDYSISREYSLPDSFTADGSLSRRAASSLNSSIRASVQQADGKVIIGGSFTGLGGILGRNYITRLNTDGTVDAAFAANVDSTFVGDVFCLAIQADGKILVGGSFFHTGGVSMFSLVRLNTDGTLDTAFSTNSSGSNKFNNTVYSVAVDSLGSIIACGAFTTYAGTSGRHRVIKLNTDGTTDTVFAANAVDSNKFNNTVYSVSVQSDNKIIIGGMFINYAGTTSRDRVVRLNVDGTLDTAFCTNAVDGSKFNTSVYATAITSTGTVLVGGEFTYAGTTGRDKLVCLNSDGTLNTTFTANSTDGAKFNDAVFSLDVFSSDKVLVGGSFLSYNSTANLSYAILLNSTGTLDSTYSTSAFLNRFPAFTIIYSSLALSDGSSVVGGNFASYTGHTLASFFVKTTSTGTPDTSYLDNFNLRRKFNGTINAVVTQTDGKILVGGGFADYDGTAGRSFLVRLNADGTTDTAFCTNAVDGNKFSSSVSSIAVQADGKILVGGNFVDYGGTVNRNRFIRLNADGTLDTAFTTNSTNGGKFTGSVVTIAVQADGKILAGGTFTNYNGTTNRNRLVRLNADGTLDTAFCTNAVDGDKFALGSSGGVIVVSTQPDNKILVGGGFINYAGTTGRNRLVRLNPDGTLDTAFTTNSSDGSKFSISYVASLEVQMDGSIYVGGGFANYAGTTGRDRAIVLNSDGTTETVLTSAISDSAKFNNLVLSFSTLSNGKIAITGSFTNYAGTTGRNRVVFLEPNGSISSDLTTNFVDGSKIASGSVTGSFVRNSNVFIYGNMPNYGGVDTLDYIVGFVSTAGTTELVEVGTVYGTYRTSTLSWALTRTFTGNDAGVVFNISPTGQMGYTATSIAGLPSDNAIKYFVKLL